jgi:hypothetical protein
MITIVSCLALSFCARQEAGRNTTDIKTASGETREQPDSANQPKETAEDVDFTDAYYKIPIKETPEYHSFIYRYERMREEQLDLLVASVTQYGLTVDMTSSQSLNSAGYGLYEKKDYAGAVRFFREAAYVDINNVYAHYNLACSLSLLRDSIWADPEARMDYHHNFNADYYAVKYRLYEPDDNYFCQADNDEICRNEIFEHLALACLQDRQYLAKAPADPDLVGVSNTLRFKRLRKNIQTGKGAKLYGVWYSPHGLMKESYFMLDGSISHILPNDRPGMQFADFEYYEDFFINTFTDEVIQSRTSQEYTFAQFPTGYEGFDTGGIDCITQQWDWENGQLIVYSVFIISDGFKLQVSLDAIAPEFDFRYFKDVLKVWEDSLTVLSIEKGKEYIHIYTPPYRYVMDDDRAALSVAEYDDETINTLAALALIHDRRDILDVLMSRKDSIDMNHQVLLSCLFAKTDFFMQFESGAWGFDIQQFLAESGTALFNYAAASGNVSFFETLYAKYFNRVTLSLSNQRMSEFKEGLWSWSNKTSNNTMNRIMHNIQEGKYNGN